MQRARRFVLRSKCLRYTLDSYQTKLVSQNGYGKGSPTLYNFEITRNASTIDTLYPSHHVFADRHIGPNRTEMQSMLEYIGVEVSYSIVM